MKVNVANGETLIKGGKCNNFVYDVYKKCLRSFKATYTNDNSSLFCFFILVCFRSFDFLHNFLNLLNITKLNNNKKCCVLSLTMPEM